LLINKHYVLFISKYQNWSPQSKCSTFRPKWKQTLSIDKPVKLCQFMKKHVYKSLTEAKGLHNKAKEHYIAFKSQIVENNPIVPQEQNDGDDDDDDEQHE